MSTQKPEPKTDELPRAKTYRRTAGLMSAVDVDRPEWAQDLAVNDEVAFGTGEKVHHARIAGFSVDERFPGRPAVYAPPELRGEAEARLLVLDEHHLVEVDDG